MANADKFYISARSITSGGKVHKKHKVVTAKVMGLTEEQFAHEVKRGAVKKGTPPDAKKKTAAAPPPALREDRIKAAIDSLYNADGTRVNDEDFTQDDKPTCDVLNAKALVPNEHFIDATERDAAWDKYLEAKTSGGSE